MADQQLAAHLSETRMTHHTFRLAVVLAIITSCSLDGAGQNSVLRGTAPNRAKASDSDYWSSVYNLAMHGKVTIDHPSGRFKFRGTDF